MLRFDVACPKCGTRLQISIRAIPGDELILTSCSACSSQFKAKIPAVLDQVQTVVPQPVVTVNAPQHSSYNPAYQTYSNPGNNKTIWIAASIIGCGLLIVVFGALLVLAKYLISNVHFTDLAEPGPPKSTRPVGTPPTVPSDELTKWYEEFHAIAEDLDNQQLTADQLNSFATSFRTRFGYVPDTQRSQIVADGYRVAKRAISRPDLESAAWQLAKQHLVAQLQLFHQELPLSIDMMQRGKQFASATSTEEELRIASSFADSAAGMIERLRQFRREEEDDAYRHAQPTVDAAFAFLTVAHLASQKSDGVSTANELAYAALELRNAIENEGVVPLTALGYQGRGRTGASNFAPGFSRSARPGNSSRQANNTWRVEVIAPFIDQTKVDVMMYSCFAGESVPPLPLSSTESISRSHGASGMVYYKVDGNSGPPANLTSPQLVVLASFDLRRHIYRIQHSADGNSLQQKLSRFNVRKLGHDSKTIVVVMHDP